MKKQAFMMMAIALIVLASACKTEKKEAAAPFIEMEKFFKNGEKSSFRISPDGKYYSYRSDFKGKMNIFVQKVGDTAAVRVTSDTMRSIGMYFWKTDRIVYLQDVGGDENYQIFSVNTEGTDLKALTPFPGVRSGILDAMRFVPGREKEMLVTINKRDPQYFDPYLLNIETGELNLVYENKENFDGWYTDNNGIIRMASKTDGVNVTYLYRNNEQEAFAELLTTSFKESFSPQNFDADNKNLYVLSNIGRDKVALVEYDPINKKEVKELFSNPEFDLSYIFYDEKRKVLAAVIWSAEKSEIHFFDQEWKKIYEGLQEQFKDYEISLAGSDDARTTGILSVHSDRLPGKYYVYDFATLKTTEVANPYPWIDENHMASMKPVKYTTRDGLTIHGYLTLPKGVEAKNLPVVVNPHGGPWARDEWYYNPEIQFLANRGYAVFQMNFRGSTGYGRKFWEASFKEWGKKMQDDITDGVEYLVKEGIADPKRVAIYGGSYGGYATLAGITLTPDLYCCAVDYVGVSNLFTFMNTIPPYWKPYLDQFHEMVGDPVKDSVMLREASPVFHADKIKVPLFIAQGANDPRVNKAESDQMVEALKARGIEVEYMVKDDEGHGFHNQDNQYDFYGAMEKFFDKHLKPAKTE
ncbi:MAG TPA: S9 family peptidase [Bacteroidales bacterium]|nr:S9 family peptidase [Bacteroidales bacterium]HSA44428.1 S9 family peptidase [Bacteroidales bacterium]